MTRSGAFEQVLRADPELLRSIVNQAADAVCLHEVGGRILDVNRRMCETLGYSREELLALSVMDIDVTATREETAKAASKLVPGEPVWAERVLRRKDGSTFPIELSLSRVVFGERQRHAGDRAGHHGPQARRGSAGGGPAGARGAGAGTHAPPRSGEPAARGGDPRRESAPRRRCARARSASGRWPSAAT